MVKKSEQSLPTAIAPSSPGGENKPPRAPRGGGRGGRGGGHAGYRGRDDRPKDEWDLTIVDLARVTRVMAGGKRMRFRACVVVGDRKGRAGMAVRKGADVQIAVAKATTAAKKHPVIVKLQEGTIPHAVEVRFRGAHVLLRSARPGTGIIAGGVVRVIMELAGVQNIVAKMKGSNNKISNVTAVMRALQSLRTQEEIQAVHKQ